MTADRVGRYRVTKRVKETPLDGRGASGSRSNDAGSRLLCDAERQGDAAARRLYVVRLASEKTRESLADSFVACTSLVSDHVLGVLDAGSFGDRVYLAMSLGDASSLSGLRDAISRAPAEQRAAIVASIGADVAKGLAAGHDHAGRGFVHDAIDPDSVYVDATGRARVDPAFLDPWIAAETIATSAAAFVAPERWTAPSSSDTDVRALAAILTLVLGPASGEVGKRVAALLASTRRTKGGSPRAFAQRLAEAADLAAGAAALGAIVESARGPASQTRVGIGAIGAADDERGKGGAARPIRVPAGAADADAPPLTSRMGSLEVIDEESENDATVVEPSPFFEELRPKGPKPDEKTPIAIDIPKAAESLRSLVHGPEEESDEEDGSTVVAPQWTAAMAKATSPDHPIVEVPNAPGGRRTGTPFPGTRSSGLRTGQGARPGTPAPEAKNAGTPAPEARRYAREAKEASRTPAPAPRAIPNAPAFPIEPAKRKAADLLAARSSPPPRTHVDVKPTPIDVKTGIPVLWSEDSSADSEELATVAREPAPAAPSASGPPNASVAPLVQGAGAADALAARADPSRSPPAAPIAAAPAARPFPISLVLACVVIVVAVGLSLAILLRHR